MESDDGGFAGREARQGRFDTSSIQSVLPTRLIRLAALPWFECWTGQLRAEKKSQHTIRAYTVAARGFSTTALPDENEIDWNEIDTVLIPFRLRSIKSDIKSLCFFSLATFICSVISVIVAISSLGIEDVSILDISEPNS